MASNRPLSTPPDPERISKSQRERYEREQEQARLRDRLHAFALWISPVWDAESEDDVEAALRAVDAFLVSTQQGQVCCSYCGDLSWTTTDRAQYGGRVTHKHACPDREDGWCQSHPGGCKPSIPPRDPSNRG